MLRRSTPIKRKTPDAGFPPKLPKHRRMKQAARAANAVEKRHHDAIASMPCVRCGRTPVHVHHVMHMAEKEMRRDHRYVVPLCAECHQGPKGVHGLGSEKAFEEYWETESLAAWAKRQWRRTLAREGA